jgi:hypothetical protein
MGLKPGVESWVWSVERGPQGRVSMLASGNGIEMSWAYRLPHPRDGWLQGAERGDVEGLGGGRSCEITIQCFT